MQPQNMPADRINALLIDDEKHSLDSLQIELSMHCPQVEVLEKCKGAKAGLHGIRSLKPDLIFLDIEMPGMNGFELLKQLDDIDFEIIFTTAYDEFAIQAFKVSAMDYLLKPIDPEELVAAVGKVEEKRRQSVSKEHVEMLLTNMRGGSDGFTKIALPSSEGLDFINVKDILHCEADGNYTTVNTTSGDRYIISRTLKEFEEMLASPDFFRTHQSHLVNLNHIKKYIRGSGGELVLQDGTHVQVARARKELLMSRIYK